IFAAKAQVIDLKEQNREAIKFIRNQS
ncbi:MAG: epoxyqueuosine reductase QueH, partial [Lactococcus cremoris]